MKKSVIALLLTALVLPGSGHLYLQQKRFGKLLIAVVVISLLVFLYSAMNIASTIAEQIANGQIAMDSAAILAEMHKPEFQTKTQSANIASLVLIGCWLVGVVDVIRLIFKKTAPESSR